METLFFTTGQAARELGVTQDRVRNLCDAGVIAAEMTAGGQYRILQGEVERLKVELLKKGALPAVPRPLPGGAPIPSPSGIRVGPQGLLAKVSQMVVSAAEEVAITENLLRKRKLDRKLEKTLVQGARTRRG